MGFRATRINLSELVNEKMFSIVVVMIKPRSFSDSAESSVSNDVFDFFLRWILLEKFDDLLSNSNHKPLITIEIRIIFNRSCRTKSISPL